MNVIEQSCLNCSVKVSGQYCYNCGQNNAIKKVAVKTIFSDFLDDYFTVDSKMLKSLIPLLIKPGFLTIEYLKGGRMSYVKPFRIYIITSRLFFFFVFFSSGTSQVKNGEDPVLHETNVEGVATLNNNSADSIQNNYNISLNQDTTRSDSGCLGLANYYRKSV